MLGGHGRTGFEPVRDLRRLLEPAVIGDLVLEHLQRHVVERPRQLQHVRVTRLLCRAVLRPVPGGVIRCRVMWLMT